MLWKWKTSTRPQPRNVSDVLLDFVFKDAESLPEVIEEASEVAWQKWLDAVAHLEAVVDFEPTRPEPYHTHRGSAAR